MSVPPLRLGDRFDSYIGGEVIIHPSAVLAPGVILQASPNSKIIIGSGVCIGMGSILQVHEGTLEVEAGVNLGAGFLMVGQGKIGANACIGAATTIFNCSVESGQVIPPGSILGDTSRRISNDSSSNSIKSESTEDTSRQETPTTPIASTPPKEEPLTESSNSIGTYIYGQENIQRLMITLFPHKKNL